MWTIWGTLAAFSAAIFIYRVSLTRNEEDQLYLDEAFNHEKAMQEAIVAKVTKTDSVFRLSLWLVGGATMLMILWGFVDIAQQFM
jgi:hypothetical protein